jgi:AraC-like DNA-binding protein
MEFSALNYAAPEHVRYRYRLQNFDNHWLQANDEDGAAVAVYNAMPPGRYHLQIQCAIANGEWGPTLTKEITICPPWWQTWWFRLAYSFMFIVTILGGVYFYLKHQKERMARKSEEMVNSMFEVRDKARRHFAQQLNISPARMALNSQEENFISRLIEVIEININNTEYSVEQMARDVAMERTGLYRKLQAIAGITPSEFLRSVRLKRAAQILEDNKKLSITEISELVGFTSSRHFATCFKQMFGCTPSDYRKG